MKSYRHYKPSIFVCNADSLICARYKNCSFWKCELKSSEHACQIFFNYSKLCVISFVAKKVHYSPPKHASRTNSRNIIVRRNPFDGDSFASQSRFDTYPASNKHQKIFFQLHFHNLSFTMFLSLATLEIRSSLSPCNNSAWRL